MSFKIKLSFYGKRGHLFKEQWNIDPECQPQLNAGQVRARTYVSGSFSPDSFLVAVSQDSSSRLPPAGARPGLAHYPNSCPTRVRKQWTRKHISQAGGFHLRLIIRITWGGFFSFLMEHFRSVKQNSITNSTFPLPSFNHQLMADLFHLCPHLLPPHLVLLKQTPTLHHSTSK